MAKESMDEKDAEKLKKELDKRIKEAQEAHKGFKSLNSEFKKAVEEAKDQPDE
jgi:hypothetical protein